MNEVSVLNGYLLKDKKAKRYYNTVEDMKEDITLKAGMYVETKGYYQPNDNGGAKYFIVSNSTKYYEELDNQLKAELIIENYMNPEKFGAKADGISDDSSAFVNAINSNSIILLSNKTYLINNTIRPTKEVNIIGDNSIIMGCGLQIDYNTIIENVNFEDIKFNAIELFDNNLLLKNCSFNNIGTDENIDPAYLGCAVYTIPNDNHKKLYIEKCNFKFCHGHGAIFCSNEMDININNNYFEKNHYRAITLYRGNNNYIISGTIRENKIIDCGVPNTTNSGVGCNGIYSVNGYEVDVINNIIKNSYENGIEGHYKSIIGNIVDGTGMDLTNHPTPSIEGIFFYPNANYPMIIKDNIVINCKRRGINFTSPNENSTGYVLIENNIVNVDEFNNEKYSIYINTLSTQNVNIINNKTNADIYVTNPNPENCYYSGDIKLLTTSAKKMNVISNLNTKHNYHKEFSNLDDWTYSNCVPTIVDDSVIGTKVVSIPYQQWNRFISPKLPYYNGLIGKIRLYSKGNFTIKLYNDSTYNKDVAAFNDNEYTVHEVYFYDTSDNKSNKNLWLQCNTDSEIDIQSFDINYLYY